MSRRIATIGFTLLTITVNALANILPINGQTTGEISDRFAIRFVPAGYVFSIWGLIYIGLIAFAIYQAAPARRGNKLFDQIAPAYWLASLANAGWILLWHYEQFPLTLAVIAVLLASLIAIYREVKSTKADTSFRWCVQIPFAVYLGWVSVATIANASQVLTYLQWGAWGLSAESWAVIMLVVASVLGAAMLLRERDAAYTLVLVWAFVGIALKQADSALVANAAWALATLLAAGSGWVTLQRARND
ncbi:MAG: tryptophan-rich sensory protein [Anaerolineales bacterium]|nr:MAG: tryptophan-rich sensory protein [Anaerolineales bacterium]